MKPSDLGSAVFFPLFCRSTRLFSFGKSSATLDGAGTDALILGTWFLLCHAQVRSVGWALDVGSFVNAFLVLGKEVAVF